MFSSFVLFHTKNVLGVSCFHVILDAGPGKDGEISHRGAGSSDRTESLDPKANVEVSSAVRDPSQKGREHQPSLKKWP